MILNVLFFLFLFARRLCLPVALLLRWCIRNAHYPSSRCWIPIPNTCWLQEVLAVLGVILATFCFIWSCDDFPDATAGFWRPVLVLPSSNAESSLKLWWWTKPLASIVFPADFPFLQCVSVNLLPNEVRPWKALLPKIVSLDNAYRPRKGEEDRIPHSFTFRKRESSPAFIVTFVFSAYRLFVILSIQLFGFCTRADYYVIVRSAWQCSFVATTAATLYSRAQWCFCHCEASYVRLWSMPTRIAGDAWRWIKYCEKVLGNLCRQHWRGTYHRFWTATKFTGTGWCFCALPKFWTCSSLFESFGWKGP